ncbi:cytochrome c [Flavobacterium okayamense]|uniref:Cytochrome c domain-containing protein n=1 Tax=Flavobacterium okayamense TaxID=2830782 RepID=A0ABM7SCJ8_9FLAO|nr:cytochrome c [Flavobacterium okayamense]BCY28498.1 hypothetical protein KK2020170_13660 [Flavobacterium okayamense]
MKRLRIYIFIFSILTFLSVIFIIFTLQNNAQKLNCATPEPTLICGTISLTENENKGKEIFDSNCSACHRLHKNMTGPALANIDSIKLKTWLTFKNQIDTTKVKTFKKVYHIATFSNNLDKEDIESLYDYLKQ